EARAFSDIEVAGRQELVVHVDLHRREAQQRLAVFRLFDKNREVPAREALLEAWEARGAHGRDVDIPFLETEQSRFFLRNGLKDDAIQMLAVPAAPVLWVAHQHDALALIPAVDRPGADAGRGRGQEIVALLLLNAPVRF